MGSATSNFYHDAYSRQGWAEVAARVRERWQAGDRDGAAGLVTDEMVLATTLIGTEDMVRARLRTWREAGVDTVRLYPAGDTLAARLDNLGRGIDLIRSLGSAGSSLSRTGLLPAPASCKLPGQRAVGRSDPYQRVACPVTRAMTSKSRSWCSSVRPCNSAVAATTRSTGPALRCWPRPVSPP